MKTWTVHLEPVGAAKCTMQITAATEDEAIAAAWKKVNERLIRRDAQVWEDLKTMRRLAVVGGTAMAEGYDAAPFLDTLPAKAEEAWSRLADVFDPR